ncbi:unnamed protein product, partial [Amoebophrya sp. A25]
LNFVRSSVLWSRTVCEALRMIGARDPLSKSRFICDSWHIMVRNLRHATRYLKEKATLFQKELRSKTMLGWRRTSTPARLQLHCR